MNYLPDLNEIQTQQVQTTTFLGYNHNEIIQDGEMYDMKNLSGRSYPLLDQRRKRGITSLDAEGNTPVPLNGIHGRDQLCFIRGSQVYWALTPVGGLTVSTSSDMLPKKIVSFGAYVCIWPDKVYFNTADLNDYGSMERLFAISGSGVSLTMCRGDGTDYDMTSITISVNPPANPSNGKLWLDQSGDSDVLRQYNLGTDEWVEVPSTYVKISATGIGNGLSMYDTVSISGLEAPSSSDERLIPEIDALNGSMIVYFAGTDYIVVAGLLNRAVASLAGNTVHVDRKVPNLDFITESNNRLWGCKYGLENGVIVNEIRASKLGDFKNWSCFMGLATDSYTASVGTDGPFTGAVTQLGYPVIFKEDCIHRVSGNMPSNFTITTTKCRGIQEGSWRSAVVVNEAIFYKSRSDVMMYDGSMPQSISTALGGMLYSDARAGAVDGRYYISMLGSSGEWSMFCYDTKTNLWYKEDDFHALGFGCVDDDLYAIDEEKNALVALLGSMGDKETSIEWEAVFGLFGTDYVDQKYLSRFNIRMGMAAGAYVHLYIQYDGDGEWHDEGEIRNLSAETRTSMIPVIPRRCDHLQFRLSGTGDCKVYSIGRILEVGGDGVV